MSYVTIQWAILKVDVICDDTMTLTQMTQNNRVMWPPMQPMYWQHVLLFIFYLSHRSDKDKICQHWWKLQKTLSGMQEITCHHNHKKHDFLSHSHDMTSMYTQIPYLWAASWQNQQYGMCTQWKLRSAWASAQSDQSLSCLHEESLSP